MVKAKKETTHLQECPSFPKEELAGQSSSKTLKNNMTIK